MTRFMAHGMSNGGAIRARDGEVLTNDALRAAVPSIFATEAHESRSARFAPIPTVAVLDGLRKEGFDPVFAQQSRTRVAGKADYTKHLLRMRHRSLATGEGEAFEVILVNANDGTSAYQLMSGIFRMVCANGTFAGEQFTSAKVRHSGNAMGDVIDGAYTVLDQAPDLLAQVDSFKSIAMNRDEQRLFATAAHQLRFPTDEDAVNSPPVEADALLRVRRTEDRNPDLWTTFNRVQENVIRGGISGRTFNLSTGTSRAARTRAVNGIDQGTSLNRALMTLAEGMAALKQAA
jgi:hypothetical protein